MPDQKSAKKKPKTFAASNGLVAKTATVLPTAAGSRARVCRMTSLMAGP